MVVYSHRRIPGLVERSWVTEGSDAAETLASGSVRGDDEEQSTTSLGYIINHSDDESLRNARFQMHVLSNDWPENLLGHIPSLNGPGLPDLPRVAVAVVAKQDIIAEDAPVEILTDYGRDPLTLGCPIP